MFLDFCKAFNFLLAMSYALASHNITWDGGYLSDDYPERVVEYVYFETKITWNEARQICQGIGGDLAKVDSKHELETIVHVYHETYPDINLQNDFWIGLFDLDSNHRMWTIDCSLLSFTSNYWDTFHEGERCFKLRADTEFLGESRPCNENAPFLCERHPARYCPFIPLIPLSKAAGFSDVTTYTACQNKCARDDTCAGALFLTPSSCCLMKTGGVIDGLPIQIAMASKFCMQFIINTSTVVPPVDDISKLPVSSCGLQLESISSSISPTSTSTTVSSSTSSVVESSSSSSSPACLVPSETLLYTVYTTVHVSTHTQCTIPSTIHDVYTTTVIDNQPCTPQAVEATPTANLTDNEVLKIAEELSKNLSVDSKSTSSYLRKLTSANDSRKTSTAVGVVGIVSIAIPVLLIMSADIRRLLVFLKIIKH